MPGPVSSTVKRTVSSPVSTRMVTFPLRVKCSALKSSSVSAMSKWWLFDFTVNPSGTLQSRHVCKSVLMRLLALSMASLASSLQSIVSSVRIVWWLSMSDAVSSLLTI